MANSLSPAFVKINYVSEYAPHTLTIPTTAYDIETESFNGHNGAPDRPAAVAVNSFVDLISAAFKPTTVFTDFTVFTKADPEAPSLPRLSGPLGLVGLSAVAGTAKATQWTWTWRTSFFGLSKLVFLDVPNAGSFEKYTNISNIPSYDAIHDYWTDPAGWISGRDGGVPTTFLQIAVTLNEKLRRSYRMN